MEERPCSDPWVLQARGLQRFSSMERGNRRRDNRFRSAQTTNEDRPIIARDIERVKMRSFVIETA